jgi:hypothetical protein
MSGSAACIVCMPRTTIVLSAEREEKGRDKEEASGSCYKLGQNVWWSCHCPLCRAGLLNSRDLHREPPLSVAVPFAALNNIDVAAMPQKVVETEYPLIDSDPHASRVIKYMRPTDYALWAGATAAFPGALYLWGPLLAALTLFCSVV